MVNLRDYVDKIVNIECFDGDRYNKYYICDFTIWYDNDDREEDSIDIMVSRDANSGFTLYADEIKSIEVIE